MPKFNKKNIKITNFLKKKKQNNQEQIIYRTSDSLSLSNDTNSKSDKSDTSMDDKTKSSSYKSYTRMDDKTKSSSYKSDTRMDDKTKSSFESEFKTQSISKSPILKSTKSNTDSDFNNWDIDIISSKINKISTIDNYSENSKTNNSSNKSKTNNSSNKSKKEFSSTNSD